jgi:septal ring-binding cell division protein DamX
VTEENRRENLAVFLAESQTAVELGKLYVYKAKIRGGVWFSVLYNEYETFNDARKALDRLPDNLKQSAPFVRRIRNIEALG